MDEESIGKLLNLNKGKKIPLIHMRGTGKVMIEQKRLGGGYILTTCRCSMHSGIEGYLGKHKYSESSQIFHQPCVGSSTCDQNQAEHWGKVGMCWTTSAQGTL